jgi:hypothetical protein
MSQAAPTAMRYEVTGSKQPTKSGLRVISVMGTWSILWYVAKRHKVGLLATAALVGFTHNNVLPFAARELFHLMFR